MSREERALTAAAVVLVTWAMGSTVMAGNLSGRRAQTPQCKGKVVGIEDARLKIELNATDGDAGIQVFLDAEPWAWMEIFDPSGRMVFRSSTKGSFGIQGGTELFLESAEPDFTELPLAQFLRRFPEGTYSFRGRGVEGECLVGAARLTHNLPEGPELTYPLEEDPPVDPNGLVVTWEPVSANGPSIVAYEVIVARIGSDVAAVPTVSLDVFMPASATSLAVPPGFLRPDSEYEWEVLAIEASGNQTLSSSVFRTQR